MDSHYAARLIAIGRILVGATTLALPGRVGAAVGLGSRRSRALIRMVGVRDLMLGIGAFRALADGEPATGWVQAGAACDLVDAVAIIGVGPELGAAKTVAGVLIAGGAAAVGLRAAGNLRG